MYSSAKSFIGSLRSIWLIISLLNRYERWYQKGRSFICVYMISLPSHIEFIPPEKQIRCLFDDKLGIRKFPKYSDTQKICCNHSKIWTMWLYHRVMSPNDADGMANSVDPDQTPPRSSLIWVCTVCPGISVRKLRTITMIFHRSPWKSVADMY